MFISRSKSDLEGTGTANVVVPLIRTAATIGFAIAPCSLGFVIIAMSEHLIRSITMGEDPVMLVSELQNQFPNASLEVEDAAAELVAKVVRSIERADQVPDVPLDIRDLEPRGLSRLSLAGSTL